MQQRVDTFADRDFGGATGHTTGQTPAIAGGPGFSITSFFARPTRAYGIFEDRFGRVRKRFTVDFSGRWDGGAFVLDERFTYDDGVTDRREWRVLPGRDGAFTAEGTGLKGVARGQTSAGMIRMDYLYVLKMGKGGMPVRFDDRLYDLGNGRVMNRAIMKKFGITLGSLSIYYENL